MEIDGAGETEMVGGRKGQPKPNPQKRGPKRDAPKGFGSNMVSMGVNFPQELYDLIKVVSIKRSKTDGFRGRSSMSAIVSEIVAGHAPELRKEAGDELIKAFKKVFG